MESVKIAAVVVLAVLSMISAEPEVHSFESHYGQGIVARDDLKVDRDEQYIEVKVTPVSGNLIPTVNLHDFAVGYTAIRDDRREQCYILETAHTLEEMMDTFEQSVKREGFYDIRQTFTCTNKRVIESSEVYEYGERIAEFCGDYDLVYTDRKFIKKSKRSVKMMAGGSLYACGNCVGWCSP